jgi:soluble lytic murein transglycosylase-like protein
MTTYLSIITAAAKAAKVSAVLLTAICSHESRSFTLDYSSYDNGSPSYSVCQIKANSGRLMGWKGTDEMELRDPRIGIKYAALYLKYEQDRYGSEDWVKLVSSYNSGTYNESNRVKGCPRNLKYLNLVKEKLPEDLRYKLECGKNKVTQPFIKTMEEK